MIWAETVLPNLTHETLKELGVTAIGHRLKLLDAIAALRSDASGKALPVDTATTSSAPSAHPEDRAERSRGIRIRRIAGEVGLGVGTVIRLVGNDSEAHPA
jgi:hypothetical protein